VYFVQVGVYVNILIGVVSLSFSCAALNGSGVKPAEIIGLRYVL
jgi:hypothetical protein